MIKRMSLINNDLSLNYLEPVIMEFVPSSEDPVKGRPSLQNIISVEHWVRIKNGMPMDIPMPEGMLESEARKIKPTNDKVWTYGVGYLGDDPENPVEIPMNKYLPLPQGISEDGDTYSLCPSVYFEDKTERGGKHYAFGFRLKFDKPIGYAKGGKSLILNDYDSNNAVHYYLATTEKPRPIMDYDCTKDIPQANKDYVYGLKYFGASVSDGTEENSHGMINLEQWADNKDPSVAVNYDISPILQRYPVEQEYFYDELLILCTDETGCSYFHTLEIECEEVVTPENLDEAFRTALLGGLGNISDKLDIANGLLDDIKKK